MLFILRMFAKRMKGIELTGIRKMFDLAGSNAIHLGIGEPDFQPSEIVINAMKSAIEKGFNKYGPTAGLPKLRDAVAERLRKYKSDINQEEIIITASGTEGLLASIFTFIDKGDEVLIPEPGFPLYRSQVLLAGGKPVPYPLYEENKFMPQTADLKITDRTKALIVNTPSNPTGSVFGERDVNAIIDFAKEHNLIIFSDEVYDEIIYEGRHHSFLGRYDNLIYINSFSKTYAMTGWRLGYIAAKKEFVKEITKMHYYSIACPPTPTQYGALAALTGPQDHVKKMVSEFKSRRDITVKMLNEIKGFSCLLPKGTFYAFPSYTHKISSEELAMKILSKNVICTPGTAFGSMGEGHLRFSYANSIENIRKGLEIVKEVVEEL